MLIFNKSNSNFLKNANNKTDVVLVFVTALIFITLPLANIFVSIATILFILVVILFEKKKRVSNTVFLVPVSFFILMAFSLLWTLDIEKSIAGLQKSLSFIIIPLVFFFFPKFNKERLNTIFRVYSFAMILYCFFYLIMAFLNYFETNVTSCFFYNNLVPEDPGAIYMSVFASLALFYFVQLNNRKTIEKIALSVLILFLFLLSSKSIITIDFIIIVCYYAFFAKISSSTKTLTIISVSLFLFFSIFFVKEVKQRFMIEYETAFVDNTLQNSLEYVKKGKIHNVSIKEAWNNKTFNESDFFPGTALRVYQVRIFKEMLADNNIFFKGFGIEASQVHIREKAKKYHLFYDYGEYNFHNQYIQTFAELGLFGLLILIFMLVLNIKKALAKKDFLHISFAITMIMLFLSESFFCRQRGIVFFILLFCLFNSSSNQEKQNITT
jgi:O-antigen ligase